MPARPAASPPAAAVSAPIAGQVIDRIAPFLGVRRVANPGAEPPEAANKDAVPAAILGRIER